jgi:hypothetical protein
VPGVAELIEARRFAINENPTALAFTRSVEAGNGRGGVAVTPQPVTATVRIVEQSAALALQGNDVAPVEAATWFLLGDETCALVDDQANPDAFAVAGLGTFRVRQAVDLRFRGAKYGQTCQLEKLS